MMKRRDLEKPLLILETTSPLLRRLTRGADSVQPSTAAALRTELWLMAILEQEVWAERIERLLSEPYPFLRRVNLEQFLLRAARAARNPNAERDPLTVFEDARSANLQRLRNVESKDWNRSGFLEPLGAFLLCDVPRILAEQDQKNLQEISRLLGAPSETRRAAASARQVPCSAV